MAVRHFLSPWAVDGRQIANPVLERLESVSRVPVVGEYRYAPASRKTGQPSKPLCVITLRAPDFASLPVEQIEALTEVDDEQAVADMLAANGLAICPQVERPLADRCIRALQPNFEGFRFKTAGKSGTFTDNFDGASDGDPLGGRTASGGGTWTSSGSNSACDLGSDGSCRVANAGGVATSFICTDQGSGDNYTQCRARAEAFGGAGVRQSFLATSIVDANNFIGWKNHGDGSAGWRFCKVVAGSITDLITTQGQGGEWVKIEREGADGRFYQGGTGASPSWSQTGATQDVSDISGSETSQGFIAGAGDGTSGNAWTDDFEAGTLGGGGSIATATASGGMSFAGEALLTAIAAATVSGGLTLQGEAIAEGIASGLASGEITIDGTTIGAAVATALADGELAFDGEAIGAAIAAAVADGQLGFAGEALTSAVAEATASGGMAFDGETIGEALGAGVVSATASGGMTFAGQAVVEAVATARASGGMSFDGTVIAAAIEETIVSAVADGTITFDGDAVAAAIATATASGAMAFDGAADVRAFGDIAAGIAILSIRASAAAAVTPRASGIASVSIRPSS